MYGENIMRRQISASLRMGLLLTSSRRSTGSLMRKDPMDRSMTRSSPSTWSLSRQQKLQGGQELGQNRISPSCRCQIFLSTNAKYFYPQYFRQYWQWAVGVGWASSWTAPSRPPWATSPPVSLNYMKKIISRYDTHWARAKLIPFELQDLGA